MAATLWDTGDTVTEHRSNRQAIVSRLLLPMYDTDNSAVVSVAAKAIDGDSVTTSERTHYTVPSGKIGLVHRISLCNSDSVSNQASVHLIANGGSRTVANRIWTDNLLPRESIILDGPFFMASLDTIRSISAAAAADEVGLRAEVLEFDGHPGGLTLVVDQGDALTASNATYYTSPGSGNNRAIVLAATICNTDTSQRSVDLYVIESGGSAAGRKLIFNDLLEPSQTVIIPGPFLLEPGDFIQSKASVTSVVSLRLTVLEVT